MNDRQNDQRIYRIDRFFVPVNAEKEFLSAGLETDKVFDNLDGCLRRHLLLGKTSDEGSIYLTFVEWESMAVYEHALAAVQAKHKEMNMTPQSLFKRLGIEAELGVFVQSSGYAH